MKTTCLFIAILLTSALCPACLRAAPAETDSKERVAHWREDLDYFARELPARQKDFYYLMPKAKFDRVVATIKRGVPRFSDAEIVLRLTRLVASLGVGHTHVLLPSGSDPYAFHMYPIRIRWFSDGLAVVSAAREYREAVGGRLTRIGVLNPDIYVPYTLEDYLAGRDPVLDAVLHGRP